MSQVAIIGDVGGHPEALLAELRRIGADPETGTLPKGLTVVQVGDLVHRGPDSAAVVAMVDRFLTVDPQRWVQLIGNHEAWHVHTPSFQWERQLDDDSVETLRRWWREGLMRTAYAFKDVDREYLVTHAGLTHGFWRRVLDAPTSPTQAVDALQSLIGRRADPFFRAGVMLGGGKPRFDAGPLWASASRELVPSWLDGGEMPFSQVHGHTSLFDWRHPEFRCSAEIESLTVVDETAKHETTTLPGGVIVGLDPGHGMAPLEPWRAWQSATVRLRD